MIILHTGNSYNKLSSVYKLHIINLAKKVNTYKLQIMFNRNADFNMSNFSRIHFHDTDIKELIYRYKQYECLWNYNSADYKSQSLKRQAWEEIARYFRKDVNEIKRKIKYLRSAYVGEKRKVDLSKRSGNESEYRPSLFYYTDLNFLDNIVVLRKGVHELSNPDMEFETANISADADDYELESFENEEEEIDLKTPKIMSCKIEAFAEPELDMPLPSKTRSPKILSSRTLSRPAKRKKPEINKQISTKNISSPESSRKYQRKNLYTSFGKTIALQLQQMPLEVAVLAMSEIHAIITKKTLEHIKSLRSSQESWPSSDTEDSLNEMIEEQFDDSC